MGGTFLSQLEAFLAFSLTMVGVTAVVSLMVSMIHELMRSRPYLLWSSTDYFYRNYIVKLFSRYGLSEDYTSIDKASRFQFDLISRAVARESGRLVDASAIDEFYRLNALFDPRAGSGLLARGRQQSGLALIADRLSTEDFKARFVASEAGQHLRKLLTLEWTEAAMTAEAIEKAWSDTVVQLARQFEATRETGTERMRLISRRYALYASIGIVLALNLDATALLSQYLADDALRARIIARQDDVLTFVQTTNEAARSGQTPETPATGAAREGEGAVLTAFETLMPPLEEAKDAVDSVANTLKGPASGPAGESGPDGDGADGDAAVEASLAAFQELDVTGLRERLDAASAALGNAVAAGDRIKGQIERVRPSVEYLRSTFPVGWTRFPLCGPNNGDPRCQSLRPIGLADLPGAVLSGSAGAAKGSARGFADLIQWLAGLVAAVFLIGLGAPFWYQIVQSLTATIGVMRGGKAGTKDEQSAVADVPLPNDPYTLHATTERDANAEADTPGNTRPRRRVRRWPSADLR